MLVEHTAVFMFSSDKFVKTKNIFINVCYQAKIVKVNVPREVSLQIF